MASLVETGARNDPAAARVPPVDEREWLCQYLQRQMRETLHEGAGPLAETSAHVLAAPGKLLRPLLVLEACRAAGGDPALAFPAAAGTEYGHIASLVHDDIIDGDDERRGHQTLHVKYDLPAAILTGDLLVFEAFLSYTACLERGAQPDHVVAAVRILAETCIETCEGQALEGVIAGRLETDEPTYLRMIRLKTASVCRAAAAIGATVGGAPAPAIAAVSRFAEGLGIAFQIVDDVLSFTGDDAAAGKPLGSDARNHRVTLPIIYALQSGRPSVRARIERAFQESAADTATARRALLDAVVSTGALARTRAQAERYTADAQEHLAALPPSAARERLHALANQMLRRDH